MEEFLARLSPEVIEIIRQDLIQKVGNALRFKHGIEKDNQDLEQIAQESNRPNWGVF